MAVSFSDLIGEVLGELAHWAMQAKGEAALAS
jgi:hypothetical protein